MARSTPKQLTTKQKEQLRDPKMAVAIRAVRRQQRGRRQPRPTP